MAMGREGEVQDDLMMTWAEMPRSPGHVFYDRLQNLLAEAGFDAFVEETCNPYYAPRMGAPSLPPGRYFRMHMIGYFEGLDSERGIVWRCADSRSLGDFLRLGKRDTVPDHSWLSKTRSRLPHEVHEKVFAFVLKLVAERGLVKGERIGVDGSTMEANAALRTIMRRDNGLSSDAKCNTPCRFGIGVVDQDLRECCDASLFTSVGRGKRSNCRHEGGRPVHLRHRQSASTSQIHDITGTAAQRPAERAIFAASRRRSLSITKAA